MLRIGACALLVALLVASSATAKLSSATGDPHRVLGGCRHQGGRTVVSAKPARIFVRNHVPFEGYFGTAAFGCASRSAQRVFLEEDEDPYYLSNFALAGKYVAYQEDECPAGCSQALLVVNLRTAGLFRSQAPTSLWFLSEYDQISGVGPVHALELNARGSIAWTVGLCHVNATPCPADQAIEQVWADGHLGRHLLDAGREIAPESLALHGHVATWTNAGVARSAHVD